MGVPAEGGDNNDIRGVLRQLIAPEGIAPDPAALCDDSADAAARMRAFMLDHVHNESRLAQVLDELARPATRDAA